MPRQRDDSDDDDDERSDSDLSGEESDVEDEEEEEEEQDEEDEELKAAEAKHNLVEADLAEIKKMVEEMDKIKMRLQFRLAREQSTVASSPSRRRSSVDEIFIPPTVAAAVQTTWDMSRMYEVEKLVSSSKSTPPKPEAREAPPPIAPSVQLSMEDLAKSYGIDDVVFGTKQPASPLRQNSGKPSVMEDFASHQPTRQASMRPTASIWDGLVAGGASASDLDNGSMASSDKPPKLNRSQLLPNSESGERPASPVDSSVAMLEDSFGAPASPTRSDAFAASANSHAEGTTERGKATMEQKEMEAMKNLLFFYKAAEIRKPNVSRQSDL